MWCCSVGRGDGYAGLVVVVMCGGRGDSVKGDVDVA